MNKNDFAAIYVIFSNKMGATTAQQLPLIHVDLPPEPPLPLQEDIYMGAQWVTDTITENGLQMYTVAQWQDALFETNFNDFPPVILMDSVRFVGEDRFEGRIILSEHVTKIIVDGEAHSVKELLEEIRAAR